MPNCNRRMTRTADSLCSSANFTADEVEVAGILLNLPDLVKESKSSCSVLPLWSVRKKRSSIGSESPAPPPNSPPVTGKLDIVSTSPVSPLAFPSSIESDPKLILQKKKTSLGVKAALLKESKKLTDLQEQLQKEVKKVKAYRDELMAENTLLQSRRQQMIKASSALPLSQSQSLVTVAHAEPHYLQQPLILFQYQPIGPKNLDPSGSAVKKTERLEHPLPSDLEYRYRIWMAAVAKNRTAAALARRNRSLILKAKNYNRAPRGVR
ncbi:hypothetical protein V2J09_023905 [Rumex salicifolius]